MDKIGSRSLAHLCAPAGALPLNNRLHSNLLVVLVHPTAQASLEVGCTKTTGHLRGRLFKGGEDKIRTCGRVTPTAV